MSKIEDVTEKLTEETGKGKGKPVASKEPKVEVPVKKIRGSLYSGVSSQQGGTK